MPDSGTPVATDLGIRPALTADVDALVALLSAGFHDDAVAVWIFSDPDRRREILPDFFRAFVELSIDAGGAWITADRDGVLLSLPPEAGDPGPEFEDRLGRVAGEYAEKLLTVTHLQDAHKPRYPHHYFSFGTVAEHRRGSGIGGRIFETVLRRCDELEIPGYLEASSPGGRTVSGQYGFAPIGPEIRMPGGPTLRPMWREPRELPY